MSETREQRQERLMMSAAKWLDLVGLPKDEITALKRAVAEAVTEGLLDALEPALAEMVRRGIYVVVADDGEPAYRPVLPDAEPSDELERWEDEGGSVPPASDAGEAPSSS